MTEAERKAMKEQHLALVKERYRKRILEPRRALYQECGAFTFPDEALPEQDPDDE